MDYTPEEGPFSPPSWSPDCNPDQFILIPDQILLGLLGPDEEEDHGITGDDYWGQFGLPVPEPEQGEEDDYSYYYYMNQQPLVSPDEEDDNRVNPQLFVAPPPADHGEHGVNNQPQLDGDDDVNGQQLMEPQKRQRVEENGTIEAEKARVQGSERLDDSPLGTPVLRVRVIPVSSVILALRSPFFQKLLMNGMKETNQKDITLRIAEIEEYALLELLNFMYTGDLETAEPTRVLQIMMAADKFQVADCMNHCAELLLKGIPMTTEFAMLYLDYPCSSSVETALKPVKTASKKIPCPQIQGYHEVPRRAAEHEL